ncbi:MAG: hypothetical protein CML06_18190 [Pseudomonadales bacterium]|nr:hypothetical protein [Pseudomonadales bacterium]
MFEKTKGSRWQAARYFGVSQLALAIAAPTSGVVLAQETDSSAVIEEVTVTARRRDESLADVPIAVSAINTDDLSSRQVKTDADLQYAVPGLTIRQTQGNNSLTYSIRGQSADTFSGSPSAVVAYLNDVPLTVSGASTFYDLESIQVLKGPQGTLFGRNTTGGAVLYTPAKPTNETEGSVTVSAGNLGMREVEAMINLPLVEDKVLFRAAFNTLDKDGYIDNILTGDEYGEINRDSGRVTLTVRPSYDLENITMYSYSRLEGTNTGASYAYSVYPDGAAAFLFPEAVDYPAVQEELGPYKTQHPYDADHIGDDQIFTNTTTYDINDSLTLKNIFGYTSGNTDSEQPAFGAPYPTFVTRNLQTGKAGNEFDLESYSNELQLYGAALNRRLDYIVGLYLQRAETETLWPQSYFIGTAAEAFATNHFLIDTDTAAVYTQGTYSLTEKVGVTAGVRYT